MIFSACRSELSAQTHTRFVAQNTSLSPQFCFLFVPVGALAMNCSGNLVLATAMLVSSVVLLLSLSRRRVPPPAEDISQRHQVEAPRSCLLSSDGRKGARKKKRVKFADDVKEGCSPAAIPSAEESKKLERSCKVEEQEMVGMQSNGVASAIECSC